MKKHILNLNNVQLKKILKRIVNHNYKVNQIIEWIYVKKITSFEEFTNLSKELRNTLDKKFSLRILKIVKKETFLTNETIKYTFKTTDKKYFFTIFTIKNGKNSIYVSSQIRCHTICTSCSSNKVKFIRNLNRGEIIEQILQIENDIKKKISKILFMNIEEPTFNFNNIISALNSITSSKELDISKKHITITSTGIVFVIKKLANASLGVHLTLFLHVFEKTQRKKIIFNNINNILDAMKYYLKKTKSYLTIKYPLIRKFNDSSANAHKFARLLKEYGLINPKVQINLMNFNKITETQFQTQKYESIQKFRNILKFNGINVNIEQVKNTNFNIMCSLTWVTDI
jgi:23S rRNA (adenine2503-C2)-methyltransferase